MIPVTDKNDLENKATLKLLPERRYVQYRHVDFLLFNNNYLNEIIVLFLSFLD